MKPPVLRKLDEHQEIIDVIKINGSGTKVLADNGTYINAGGLVNISTQTISSNDQELNINPENGKLYLINTGNYTGTKVSFNLSSTQSDIYIKNIGSKSLTVQNTIDGQSSIVLNTFDSIRLVGNSTSLYII